MQFLTKIKLLVQIFSVSTFLGFSIDERSHNALEIASWLSIVPFPEQHFSNSSSTFSHIAVLTVVIGASPDLTIVCSSISWLQEKPQLPSNQYRLCTVLLLLYIRVFSQYMSVYKLRLFNCLGFFNHFLVPSISIYLKFLLFQQFQTVHEVILFLASSNVIFTLGLKPSREYIILVAFKPSSNE